MKKKNEIKEIILVQEQDESKKLKIRIGEFNSKKLVNILKKLINNVYQFRKIKVNREYVDIENVRYISEQYCLLFETNKEIFALDMGEDENKLLNRILIVFNIQSNKLFPIKINIFPNEDKYLIGGDSYRLNGFILNGEIVMKGNMTLYVIDLKLPYWKYTSKNINLNAIFLQNVSKGKIILKEVESFSVVVDENGLAYNQFLYGKRYSLFPVMISNKYHDELENFSNLGYYLYNMYDNYMENEQDEN